MKGAVLLSVATVINGEECQTEQTSMIQVARMRDRSSGSHRHLQLHHNKETDETCLPVVAGDKAPVAGKFTAESSSIPVFVKLGQIAPTSGTFCVDSGTFSLLQRSIASLGLNADAVEESLVKKGSAESTTDGKAGNVDGSTQSKGGSATSKRAPKGYSMVAARCKPDGMMLGTEQVGKTLPECTALCNGNSLCAAFEFEYATGECELVSGVDKELALQDEDGACNEESCCYGRPLPAPSGYSMVAARCKPDGMSLGAEQVGKTLAECQAMCDGNADCAAFEFEFASGECEMVSGVDKELALQDEDGPCNGESCCYGRPLPAPSGYSMVAARCKPDGMSLGAEQVGKTLAECQALCDGNAECAAFEFEFASGECEMVSGVDKELALQDEDGPCNGESCCYGRPLAAPTGYSMVAARCKPDGMTLGVEMVGKTLAECAALCNDNAHNCAGFEFEYASGECEMVLGVDKELALQDEDGACNGESCCYGRPLPAPSGYSMVAARCKPDGMSLGAELVGKTLRECTAICNGNSECAAFEFEFASGECEMVSGVDKELALQDEDGPCNGESCCYGRPLPAPSGYSMVAARCKPDGMSLGAEQVGKTLAECQALCDGNAECAAFEFEFASGECEMVSAVDKELALQDEDGPCNGESCCYEISKTNFQAGPGMSVEGYAELLDDGKSGACRYMEAGNLSKGACGSDFLVPLKDGGSTCLDGKYGAQTPEVIATLQNADSPQGCADVCSNTENCIAFEMSGGSTPETKCEMWFATPTLSQHSSSRPHWCYTKTN